MKGNHVQLDSYILGMTKEHAVMKEKGHFYMLIMLFFTQSFNLHAFVKTCGRVPPQVECENCFQNWTRSCEHELCFT